MRKIKLIFVPYLILVFGILLYSSCASNKSIEQFYTTGTSISSDSIYFGQHQFSFAHDTIKLKFCLSYLILKNKLVLRHKLFENILLVDSVDLILNDSMFFRFYHQSTTNNKIKNHQEKWVFFKNAKVLDYSEYPSCEIDLPIAWPQSYKVRSSSFGKSDYFAFKFKYKLGSGYCD
jgi:hypothetical protein